MLWLWLCYGRMLCTPAIFYKPELKRLCYNCLQSIINQDTEVVLSILAQWVVRIEIRSLLGSLAKWLDDGPSNYGCWMLDFRMNIFKFSIWTNPWNGTKTQHGILPKKTQQNWRVSRTWGIASPMVIWREPPAQLLFLKWSMQCLSYTAAGAYPVEWSQITPKQPRDMAEGQLANMTWMWMQGFNKKSQDFQRSQGPRFNI